MSGTLITELEEGNTKGAVQPAPVPNHQSGHGPAAFGSREEEPKRILKTTLLEQINFSAFITHFHPLV